ncbi:uncharacterized protein LOC119397569 [Rhipicephalus sanguineus]|uniref:uncharacterized protein LOC119397569 n=1 Tax=Rhipicephalus sanguineus TaxID=34632 RepID=UPI0020C55D6A|nr:uncharacterized protein LOC119397569 [Rhipicephalus sanguineus]
MALAEGGLSGLQLFALCAACLIFVVCVASATAYAVVTLMSRHGTSLDYGCRTNFCVRAREMMPSPPGAPSPCDNFYGYVCFDLEHSRRDFLGVLRLQRKSDYHESVLAYRSAAPTGNATAMLAYAHQICAQFSHQQVGLIYHL